MDPLPSPLPGDASPLCLVGSAALVPPLLDRLPLAQAVLVVLDHVLQPTFLDRLFHRHRGRSYQDVLTFPTVVRLLGDALLRHQGSARAALDQALLPFLDRTVEEVDPIERAVLRIAAYELIHRVDVPYRVVLNEAIETAKRFGSEHGHTYINGVLDHAAVEWRPAEAQARR